MMGSDGIRPNREPQMAYVLMTQYGPAFTHADFERVMERAAALLRANADDPNTNMTNAHRCWIERVEAE